MTDNTYAELKRLAQGIWQHGETSHKGSSCLNPDNPHHRALTTDREEIGLPPITHFDLHWHEKGRTVKINLYTASAYGAVMESDLKLVTTEMIDIEGEGEREYLMAFKAFHESAVHLDALEEQVNNYIRDKEREGCVLEDKKVEANIQVGDFQKNHVAVFLWMKKVKAK